MAVFLDQHRSFISTPFGFWLLGMLTEIAAMVLSLLILVSVDYPRVLHFRGSSSRLSTGIYSILAEPSSDYSTEYSREYLSDW